MKDRNFLTVNSYAERYEDGNWTITSEDLPELLLAGEDLDMLSRDLPKVIKIILEKNYNLKNVVVRRAESPISIKGRAPRSIVPEDQWNAFPNENALMA
jgi:predicted RNase H-like HicB family nuclease